MEFNLQSGNPDKQRSACLIVAVFANKKLSTAAQQLNNVSKNYINTILSQENLAGELSNSLMLHKVPNISASRVLLVGCGKAKELSDQQYKDIFTNLVKTLNQQGITEAVCCISDFLVKNRDIKWKVQQATLTSAEIQYSFDVYKSKQQSSRHSLQKLTFLVTTKQELTLASKGLAEGKAINKGIKLTKDLANSPPNICTPSYLAQQAQKMSRDYPKIMTKILAEKDMKKLGMGALLAVSQGSINPAKLITLKYFGTKANKAPVVLVGKGITFDTGGNSLKSGPAMIGMKYDMCGAAAVFGAMLFAAELKLPINLIGIIAAAENMPGSTACRPNDIVTSMSGTTIEILNTDAEGRLVLCDALTYSTRFKPAIIIDIATLTGACVIALGKGYSGLFSNQQALADSLLDAGNAIGDKCWQLPLATEYQDQLKSKVADLKNIGNGDAGSIIGACFLARFVDEKYHWAHLDIAGTAWDRSNMDAASGRPVPLLAQYLLNYGNNQAAKGN